MFTKSNNQMRKIITYLTLLYLTGFTATSNLSVMAGGCSNQMDKKVENKCTEDDTECQTKKAEDFKLNKTLRS